MYSQKGYARVIPEQEADYRSPIRRDYARLLHSPSFRRLQGKTQLFPGIESDFFRNRLTHSLEVAQIAKTIALKLNFEFLKGSQLVIDPDVCEFAGLAHDLGHPPFGHQGEEALDEVMRNAGGFEGNAQTLRILSKLEKKAIADESTSNASTRVGLNLTYRSLASILKYDVAIPLLRIDRPKGFKTKPIKGYYDSEKGLVEEIKKHVLGDGKHRHRFKSVECQIMDIADDIAYSTYDLEDGLKAGFYHPTSIFTYPKAVHERIAKRVSSALGSKFTQQDVLDTLNEIFKNIYEIDPRNGVWELIGSESKQFFKIKAGLLEPALANEVTRMNTLSQTIANDGFSRGYLTSQLVNRAVNGVCIDVDKENSSQSKVYLNKDTRKTVEVLKYFTYESQIQSPKLKIAEYRGKQIVKDIFTALSNKGGWMLLPQDYQNRYVKCKALEEKKRCLCDFIAGMTDKYAIEFYGRLRSERPESIFRPI